MLSRDRQPLSVFLFSKDTPAHQLETVALLAFCGKVLYVMLTTGLLKLMSSKQKDSKADSPTEFINKI